MSRHADRGNVMDRIAMRSPVVCHMNIPLIRHREMSVMLAFWVKVLLCMVSSSNVFYVDIFSITYLILASNQKKWFPTLREEPGTGVHIKKSSKGKCKKHNLKNLFLWHPKMH
uniref:hypothetical protein n=1 Tax=Bifidobacterium breve TaxID=1685 RepID=UPI00155DC22B|nr:hypothetical protein [Bifidobacterium breve]